MIDRRRTVWKYPLQVTDKQEVIMRRVCKILTVQIQAGEIMMWAEVQPLSKVEVKTVHCYGTGQPGPSPEQVYIGTIQQAGFVWHFYLGE